MPNRPICCAKRPPSCRHDEPTLTDHLLFVALCLMLFACVFGPATVHVLSDYFNLR